MLASKQAFAAFFVFRQFVALRRASLRLTAATPVDTVPTSTDVDAEAAPPGAQSQSRSIRFDRAAAIFPGAGCALSTFALVVFLGGFLVLSIYAAVTKTTASGAVFQVCAGLSLNLAALGLALGLAGLLSRFRYRFLSKCRKPRRYQPVNLQVEVLFGDPADIAFDVFEPAIRMLYYLSVLFKLSIDRGPPVCYKAVVIAAPHPAERTPAMEPDQQRNQCPSLREPSASYPGADGFLVWLTGRSGTMKEFTGKVAVVTGAASGIGRALAERSAREGMKVVLADVEEPALARAAAEMQASGATVLAVPTDVSRLADVENLARRTVETFGAVHLLCNNAGVGAGGPPWQCSEADWQWILGVNLWGVIHGLRVFLPMMMAQGTEGHVVNTASAAGILPFHPSAPYQVTKFAVVGLSENLHHWLAAAGSPLKASVLCPGWVKTRIMECERNRPDELRNPPGPPLPPEALAQITAAAQLVETGLAPEVVADCVFSAIREEKFYIYIGFDPWMALVAQRNDEVLHARNPAMPVFG